GSTDIKVISAEYLGLLPEEKAILIDGSTDEATLTSYWGVPPVKLKNVPVFLKQSDLSYRDLQQLIRLRYIRWANPNGALDVVFDPPSSCMVSDATLKNLSDTALSRIHRLGRLMLKTGDSMINLDRTLTAFGDEIQENFLINLSYLYRLEKMLPRNMDRDEILTWWAVMDAHDYPDAPSLYRKLFMNTTVNKPVAAQFELNATGDELLNPGTVIDLQDINPDPDLLAVVLGATRLKAKDLQLLVEAELPGGVITLNMAQLSFLFRVSSFCRAFKLSMSDYLSLKNIISVAPLASHDLDPLVSPADTLRFTEMHKVIERAGFSPEELDYLL